MRHIATMTKKSLRKSDVIARWGGEEFVMLLPNTSVNAATEIAENFRKMIEDSPFDVAGHITCSFGVTEMSKNESADCALERVDKLLYTAK